MGAEASGVEEPACNAAALSDCACSFLSEISKTIGLGWLGVVCFLHFFSRLGCVQGRDRASARVGLHTRLEGKKQPSDVSVIHALLNPEPRQFFRIHDFDTIGSSGLASSIKTTFFEYSFMSNVHGWLS